MTMKLDISDDLDNIAVLFSGGVESTLMLYMLAHQYPDKRITAIESGCSYIPFPRHLQNTPSTIHRISRLEQIKQGAINYHLVHYFDDDGGHYNEKALADLQPGMKFDVVMVGTNKVPPKGSIVDGLDLYDDCDMPWRKNPTGPVMAWDEPNGWWDYRPFKYMDKYEVTQLYHELGIFNELFGFTRSCDRTFDKYLYELRTGIETGYPCEWCWSCRERRWGLK